MISDQRKSKKLNPKKLSKVWLIVGIVFADGSALCWGIFRHIWMAQCKTAVSPLLTHWRYCSFALSHRYVPLQPITFFPRRRHDMETIFSIINHYSGGGGGWFKFCTQPMRDGVTLWRRLSLAGRKPRISPQLPPLHINARHQIWRTAPFRGFWDWWKTHTFLNRNLWFWGSIKHHFSSKTWVVFVISSVVHFLWHQ